MYFLSLLSSKLNIIIDKILGEPGHGKDILDARNACIKGYLKEKMYTVTTPEADDSTKRTESHGIVGDSKSSWIIECKKLLEDNIRVYGVKSKNKYSKRLAKQKMKKDESSTTCERCANGRTDIFFKWTAVTIWGYSSCTISDAIQI